MAPSVVAAHRRLAALLGACLLPLAGMAADDEIDVRFGPEADYGPFVFAAPDGTVRGLSVEMLARLAPHAKLRIRTLAPRPLKEWLELARRREVDLLSSLRPTPERAEFLLFSRPYVQVPAVLVVRDDHRLAGGHVTAPLSRLPRQAVAVGAGYAVESFVRAARPDLDWRPVADDVQALQGVATGKFAAAVVDSASAAFIVQTHGVPRLATAGAIGFDYALSFAVRNDRPELLARIDAAIHAIPAGERAALVARWMQPLRSAGPPSSLQQVLWPVFALLSAGAAVAVWSYARRRRVPEGRA